jgi:FRG domain
MRKKPLDDGATFEIITVDSWATFQEVVAGPKYQSWAFRGQAEARWPLYSAISRHLRDYRVHPQAWVEQESRILRIFQRKAHLFLDHVPNEDDAFQWLALMQHHGSPTRLLDFTWSPFVAAFFALERATTAAAVWAVCIAEIWNTTHKFPKMEKLLTHDKLNLRTPGNYERFFLGNTIPFVVYGEPFVMNQRLVAQSGTFIVPGVLDLSVEEILSHYPNPRRTVVKFVLNTEKIRDEAMDSLYSMNITNATLFPGLDGMARSLAYELEFHWGYNPKTMEPYPGYS